MEQEMYIFRDSYFEIKDFVYKTYKDHKNPDYGFCAENFEGETNHVIYENGYNSDLEEYLLYLALAEYAIREGEQLIEK